MHLLYGLNTAGKAGEHQREVLGENRLVLGGCPTDFTHARMTLRLRGAGGPGTQTLLLCQAVQACPEQSRRGGICSGWLLTGQPFRVTPDWSEQTVTLVPDPAQWKCLARGTIGGKSGSTC